MTLRPDTVRERLALVRTNLAELRAGSTIPREKFLADRKEQWAAAYALQTTVQALLDAGAHILSARFKESPREYGEIVPLRNVKNRVHVAADPGIVDDDDRFRARRDEPFDLTLVDIQRVRADVGENRPCPAQGESISSGNKGERRHDHLVARANVK